MIHVVLIEDDVMIREINHHFVERVEGFRVVGTASNGVEGMELIRKISPQLVLIDVYMPHQDGMEVLQLIREKGYNVDVIAITAASDMETIKFFLHQGVFDYIMKPFKFERVKKSLEKYRDYRQQFQGKGHFTQKEVDKLFFSEEKESRERVDLPKGLHGVTLEKIKAFLIPYTEPISAEELAEGIGIARVTARRYLDFLEKCGEVEMMIQYGGIGRPINRYLLHKRG